MKTKTTEELIVMREGGAKLATIKEELRAKIVPGAVPQDIDKEAEELIRKAGGEPSFKMVKGYLWTTCININDGVVHGIPTRVPFKEGDIVSLDIGMFYKGFHTDTSFTTPVGKIAPATQKFLKAGEEALNRAIKNAKVGKRISHISMAIQDSIERNGYSAIRALTGHGVGERLHEEPAIPCFWETDEESGELIKEGAVLAIEVIYTMGRPDLVLSADDNLTISTKDGKISGLFEETVAVEKNGPVVLTA